MVAYDLKKYSVCIFPWNVISSLFRKRQRIYFFVKAEDPDFANLNSQVNASQ
jgi:hypothetical protein